MNASDPQIWIVIPTYNEALNIEALLKELRERYPQMAILVVDDASPDGTGAMVDRLRLRHPEYIHLLSRPTKQGIGSAYRQGFQFVLGRGAQIVIEMDADFSHEPTVIASLVAAIHSGADVAVGSRRVAGGRIVGWGAWRQLMSWGAMTISRWVLGLKTRDVTSGFKAYRRMVLEAFHLDIMTSDGYAFQEETIFRAERRGFRIVEIPIVFHDRSAGVSKLSKVEILKFFLHLFQLRFHGN